MTETIRYEGGLAEAEAKDQAEEERFRNFSAVQDVPPQKTLFLHVSGDVLVGNPGVEAKLVYAIPQGMNPDILLLRLILIQRPGMWTQVMTWAPASYTTMLMKHGQYTQVQLIHDHIPGITLDVLDRH
jgi:hypothetical protein